MQINNLLLYYNIVKTIYNIKNILIIFSNKLGFKYIKQIYINNNITNINIDINKNKILFVLTLN